MEKHVHVHVHTLSFTDRPGQAWGVVPLVAK